MLRALSPPVPPSFPSSLTLTLPVSSFPSPRSVSPSCHSQPGSAKLGSRWRAQGQAGPAGARNGPLRLKPIPPLCSVPPRRRSTARGLELEAGRVRVAWRVRGPRTQRACPGAGGTPGDLSRAAAFSPSSAQPAHGPRSVPPRESRLQQVEGLAGHRVGPLARRLQLARGERASCDFLRGVRRAAPRRPASKQGARRGLCARGRAWTHVYAMRASRLRLQAGTHISDVCEDRVC